MFFNIHVPHQRNVINHPPRRKLICPLPKNPERLVYIICLFGRIRHPRTGIIRYRLWDTGCIRNRRYSSKPSVNMLNLVYSFFAGHVSMHFLSVHWPYSHNMISRLKVFHCRIPNFFYGRWQTMYFINNQFGRG